MKRIYTMGKWFALLTIFFLWGTTHASGNLVPDPENLLVKSTSQTENSSFVKVKGEWTLFATFNPENAQTGVEVGGDITINFDEAAYIDNMGLELLSNDNVSGQVFLWNTASYEYVDCAISYNQITFTITLNPVEDLLENTVYRIELGSLVDDSYNPLDINASEFTTESIPFELVSAVVENSNPEIVIFTFNKEINYTTLNIDIFIDNVSVGYEYAGIGLNPKQLEIDLYDPVTRGQEVKFSYTPGDIQDNYGNYLGAFSEEPVTNNIKSPQCDILSFQFLYGDNTCCIPKTFEAMIIGNNIDICLSERTTITGLVASFTTSEYVQNVKIGSNIQTSGSTINDFSSPLIYTVTADNGSTKSYTVSVSTPNRVDYSEEFDDSWTNINTLLGWMGDGTASTAWHRDDYFDPSDGAYSPAGALETSHSARFHSYEIEDGQSFSIVSPALDFNFPVQKALSFYMINEDGLDSLEVFFSEDGGANWGKIGTYFTTGATWEKKIVEINSFSEFGRIKFTATSDYGVSDIGIDQFSVFAIFMPEIATSEVTAVSMTKALCGGELQSSGNIPLLEKGVCWGYGVDVTLETCISKVADASGEDVFTSALTPLSAGSIYYARAYASNEVGNSYGESKIFTTSSTLQSPTVTANEAIQIGLSKAKIVGNITDYGDLNFIESGMVYSTISDPLIGSPGTIALYTDPVVSYGEFSFNLSGLEQNTTYYYKTFARNQVGLSYSIEKEFTTQTLLQTFPFTEVFSDMMPPVNWQLVNEDYEASGITWDQISVIQQDEIEDYVAYLNHYNYNEEGQKDGLITPFFNLSGLTTPILSFHVSYARYDDEYYDRLRIYVSTDEGITFMPVPIFDKEGSELATYEDEENEYFPSGTDDWRLEKINLSGFKTVDNVCFKFETTNGYGNNLFIDNVTIRNANNDKNLKSLSLNAGALLLNPAFIPSITSYKANAPTGTSLVLISAEANDVSATVVGDTGTISVSDGLNELTITCIADDMTVKDYTINFTVGTLEPVGNGNWDNPAVWGGTVPGPGDNVVLTAGMNIVIPAGKATVECLDLVLEPLSNLSVDGALTVNGDLLIKSDATGSGSLIDKGTLNVAGTKTVELYIPQSDRYYYVAIPLTGITASVFGDITGTEMLYVRNTTTSTWERITIGATVLSPGVGYAIRLTGAPRTVNFVGTSVTTGAFSPSIVFSGDKWNLIGNPYPSPIDWGAENSTVSGWIINNVRNTVYVKHGATFAIWNGAEDGESLNGGSRYIPAMQAFWIKALGASPTADMSNLIRVHNGNLLMKSNMDLCQKLRVKVAREAYTDEALLKFHSNSENSVDKLDAEKLFATDAAYPQLYMNVENEKMAIASHSLFSGVYHQPLAFRTDVAGQFTFTFSEMESFGAATEIYLEDKIANKMVNLNLNSVYAFESGICDTDSRFVIHIADGTTHFNPFDYPGTTEIDGLGVNVNVYGYDNSIFVKAEKAISATVKVYNLLGAEVARVQMDGDFAKIELSAQGHYIVKVLGCKISKVEKVNID